jgi:hypothetical protein
LTIAAVLYREIHFQLISLDRSLVRIQFELIQHDFDFDHVFTNRSLSMYTVWGIIKHGYQCRVIMKFHLRRACLEPTAQRGRKKTILTVAITSAKIFISYKATTATIAATTAAPSPGSAWFPTPVEEAEFGAVEVAVADPVSVAVVFATVLFRE